MGRHVMQMSEAGAAIAEYPSIAEASKACHVSSSQIHSGACLGRLRSGFLWKFASGDKVLTPSVVAPVVATPQVVKPKKVYHKPINKLSELGDYIKQLEDIVERARGVDTEGNKLKEALHKAGYK